MSSILPVHVRQWVRALAAAGVSPATIRHNKIVLSAAFTTALNDFVIALHPCRGVKSPAVAVKEYLTAEEFDRLHAALESPAAQLLVETAVESGLRWGEPIELRLRDVHQPSGIVTVTRSVAEVQPQFGTNGERFVVKPYPKGRRSRRFRLHPKLVAALAAYAEARGKALDDLLFTYDDIASRPAGPPEALASAGDLGLTEPTAGGHRYRHGTLRAYTAGRCRCVHCRAGFAEYRARRRRGPEVGHGSAGAQPDPDHPEHSLQVRRSWHSPPSTASGKEDRHDYPVGRGPSFRPCPSPQTYVQCLYARGAIHDNSNPSELPSSTRHRATTARGGRCLRGVADGLRHRCC